MTQSIKDSAEPVTPNKPGTGSRISDSKSGSAARSNPVCLDVGVTLRSLQREEGTPGKQFREECRTVIVFDNGAVVRCSTALPAGQAVILTNAQGKEAVCRVAVGRSLPSVKGYVEVEFAEPVDDFWKIHDDLRSPAVSMPSTSSSAVQQAPAELLEPPPGAVRQAARETTPEPPAAPEATAPSGRAPSFEDIAGLVRMSPASATPKKNLETGKPSAGTVSRGRPFETQGKPAVEPARDARTAAPAASSRSNAPELITDVSSNPAVPGSTLGARRTPGPSGDFLSGSLLSSAPPRPSSSSGSSWLTWVLVVVAVALAGYGAWVYLVQPNMATYLNGKKADAGSPPLAAMPPERSTSAPAQAPKLTLQQEVEQAQAQASDQAQPSTALDSVPPVEKPAAAEATSERRQSRQAKTVTAKAAREVDSSPSPQAAIPNLALNSPKAPRQSSANRVQQTSPLTDIVAPDATTDVPAAGVLPAVSRTANQPAPPPPMFASAVGTPATSAPAASTPAVATSQDARLISSTRPVYPEAAKQTNVQGIVVVWAQVDGRGNVVDAKALSGPMALRQAAVDAVKKWKYSPALVDGKPAPAQVNVNVDFRLK